jgi:hypothetical protein
MFVYSFYIAGREISISILKQPEGAGKLLGGESSFQNLS